ncbi:hypothetical protein BD413DRAFT_588859 [Trametes elegans]|nr:hypothetical protein BD413DRAFT_588859 [Trametes elegans]
MPDNNQIFAAKSSRPFADYPAHRCSIHSMIIMLSRAYYTVESPSTLLTCRALSG